MIKPQIKADRASKIVNRKSGIEAPECRFAGYPILHSLFTIHGILEPPMPVLSLSKGTPINADIFKDK